MTTISKLDEIRELVQLNCRTYLFFYQMDWLQLYQLYLRHNTFMGVEYASPTEIAILNQQ